MKRYERIMGVILILAAVFTIIYSLFSLGFGSVHHPGPGFMPFWAALIMLIVSTVWFIDLIKPDENPCPFCEPGQLVKPVIALIVTLIYAALMEVLGYAASTLVFLLIWQFVVERVKWHKGILFSVITTICMYLLFVYLLRVAVPEGILI